MEESNVNVTPEDKTQLVTNQPEENNGATQVNQKENQPEVTSEPNSELSKQEDINPQEEVKDVKKEQATTSQELSEENKQVNREPEPLSSDIQIANLQKQLSMVSNIAQQKFLSLCNEYGVDFRAEHIDASAEELKKRDPNGFVDFNLKLERLHADTTRSTGELQNAITYYEVNNAVQPYKQLLDSSPVTNSVVNDILSQIQYVNPTQQVNYIMNSVMNIYKEAFEAGTLYGQTNKEQIENPEAVLNNSIMSNNPSVSNEAPLKKFTREDIAKMSLEDFRKNEKLIDDLVRQGLL